MANNTGKKYGGREAGTPNKLTQSMRNFISDILNENQTQFKTDFKALTPRERIETYLKLLTFVVPKLERVEVIEEEKPTLKTYTKEEAVELAKELKAKVLNNEL